MNLPAGAHAHFTREAEQTARLEGLQEQARAMHGQFTLQAEAEIQTFMEGGNDDHDIIGWLLDNVRVEVIARVLLSVGFPDLAGSYADNLAHYDKGHIRQKVLAHIQDERVPQMEAAWIEGEMA